MEEKPEEDFMNINKNIFFLILIFTTLLFSSCKDENTETFVDELPFPAPFEVYLNLSLVSNQSLEFEKHLYLNDIGLRGVVVVKRGENDYAAFERTCPFEPEKDCSIISMDPSQLYLSCDCGNSFYNLKGFPTNSPSPKKLREYRTQLSGNTLVIDETII